MSKEPLKSHVQNNDKTTNNASLRTIQRYKNLLRNKMTTSDFLFQSTFNVSSSNEIRKNSISSNSTLFLTQSQQATAYSTPEETYFSQTEQRKSSSNFELFDRMIKSRHSQTSRLNSSNQFLRHRQTNYPQSPLVPSTCSPSSSDESAEKQFYSTSGSKAYSQIDSVIDDVSKNPVKQTQQKQQIQSMSSPTTTQSQLVQISEKIRTTHPQFVLKTLNSEAKGNQTEKGIQSKFNDFKYRKKIDIEMGINYDFSEHLKYLKSNNNSLQQVKAQQTQLSLNLLHLHSSEHTQSHIPQSPLLMTTSNFLKKSNLKKNQILESPRIKEFDISHSKLVSFNIASNTIPDRIKELNEMTISSSNSSTRSQKPLLQKLNRQPSIAKQLLIKSEKPSHKKEVSCPSSFFGVGLQQSKSQMSRFNSDGYLNMCALSNIPLNQDQIEQITKITSFIPDFISNLRYLEKVKQTKNRASKMLRQLSGWYEKMALILLVEDGNEIKKDSEIQDSIFESLFKFGRHREQGGQMHTYYEQSVVDMQSSQLTGQLSAPQDFEIVWESFCRLQYLNKSLISYLEKKEEEKYKLYRTTLLQEIVDIHDKQREFINMSFKQSKPIEGIQHLPNNIAYILDRKNYLIKEQALDHMTTAEISMGQFPLIQFYERVKNKFNKLSDQVTRNYQNYL